MSVAWAQQCLSWIHSSHLVSARKFNLATHLVARSTANGFGGGMIRLTDGTSISTPPGPVTNHLLRSLLSFRMHSSPLRTVFCKEHRTTCLFFSKMGFLGETGKDDVPRLQNQECLTAAMCMCTSLLDINSVKLTGSHRTLKASASPADDQIWGLPWHTSKDRAWAHGYCKLHNHLWL